MNSRYFTAGLTNVNSSSDLGAPLLVRAMATGERLYSSLRAKRAKSWEKVFPKVKLNTSQHDDDD